MLQVGIVGLPNVGKSTLFNVLTSAGVPAENYPFCTVDPNVGIVHVPDERLSRIQDLVGSREAVPTFIRFVDIAGLVRGASRGEGLGNQFLAQIREVDAIALVLRCFQDPDIAHVMGSVDPARDLDLIETELALADLETVERRREKVEKNARSGEKEAKTELGALENAHRWLAEGRSLRDLPLSRQDRDGLRGLNLLTLKPVLLIANQAEVMEKGGTPWPSTLGKAWISGGSPVVIPISLAIEAELALLEPSEREEFLKDLGLGKHGSHRVIQGAFDLLGLITFFTANEKQTTAWAVPGGTKAPEAAGLVHSDFERGFIRAETIGYEDLVALGSLKVAREGGAIRSEGKDYVVADGDIVLFRFNV